MGVNLVVIAENSRGITIDEFRRGLREDPYGRLAWPEEDEDTDYLTWEGFEFKGKSYFTWVFSPREPHIGLYDLSEKAEDNSRRILFFKIMLAVEKVAGGPIYTGNDVVNTYSPEEISGREFFLPPTLDGLWKEWKEVARRGEINDYNDVYPKNADMFSNSCRARLQPCIKYSPEQA